MRGIRGGALALDIDRYVEAVQKFNELVGELAAKLQQISDARDQALKASADLKRELDSTDQRMMDISSAVRQQITLEFTTKKSVVRSEDVADYPVGSRRAV